MRRILRSSLLAGMAALLVLPAMADEHEPRFKLSGELRTRLDYLENYFDLTDTNAAGANDDEGSIWPTRVRIAADGRLTENTRAYIELQYFDVFGGSSNFPVEGTFGSTQVFPPSQDNGSGNTSNVRLYQGFLELNKMWGSGLGLRVGRQEHTLGTELFLGDNDFYNGVAFDGARLWWDWEHYAVNGFFYKIDENNGGVFGTGASRDTNFWGVTGSWQAGKIWGGVDAYALFLQQKIDNSDLDTFGARWGRMVDDKNDLEGNPFDWNLEYATQSGDTGDPGPTIGATGLLPGCAGAAAGTQCDIGGDVIEAWFGWNFNQGGNSRGRVHVGWYSSSGDDNATDAANDSFVALFGDQHAHNRLGDLDFANPQQGLTDLNLGYEAWFAGDKHSLALTFHDYQRTDAPTGVDDAYASEWNLRYHYTYNEHVGFEAGLGDLSPDANLEAIVAVATGTGDNVRRAYAQVRGRW